MWCFTCQYHDFQGTEDKSLVRSSLLYYYYYYFVPNLRLAITCNYNIIFLWLFRLIANALDTLGLPKESGVAIDMPMNVTAVLIYLAIVLAGYVVVSIADSFAPKEITTRLTIANAKLIFTQVSISISKFVFCNNSNLLGRVICPVHQSTSPP